MSADIALKAIKNVYLNMPNHERIVLHSYLSTQYTIKIFEKHLASKTKYVIPTVEIVVRMI